MCVVKIIKLIILVSTYCPYNEMEAINELKLNVIHNYILSTGKIRWGDETDTHPQFKKFAGTETFHVSCFCMNDSFKLTSWYCIVS
jgi:hypothetical protein